MKPCRGVFAGILTILLCFTGCVEQKSAETTQSNRQEPVDDQITVVLLPVETVFPTMTARPTPEPTPEPTLKPVTEERLAAGEYDSFFNHAVFIGDSIANSYQKYCALMREQRPSFMGELSFVTAISYSMRYASRDRAEKDKITLRYRGNAVTISEGIIRSGAQWAFILLGVNDYAGVYPEKTLGYFHKMIDAVQEHCPEVQIVVLSVLPVTKRFCDYNETGRKIQIGDWNAFNALLEQGCREQGVFYLDVAKDLMDTDGYLAEDLSSDGRFHINQAGNELLTRALRRFAAEQRQRQSVAAFETGSIPEKQ